MGWARNAARYAAKAGQAIKGQSYTHVRTYARAATIAADSIGRGVARVASPAANATPAAAAVAALTAIAAGGIANVVMCDQTIKPDSQVPPRPLHYILRPDVDPRIDKSILIRYDPMEELRTGAAIVILPGGNYEDCCVKGEGQHVAAWLSSLGITAFVLRYRLLPEGHYWPAQLEDLETAMHMIRTNSEEWRVDKNRIGVIGFSAGGHLAAMNATTSKELVKPNLQILVYPTIDVTKPDWWPWRSAEGFPVPAESPHLLVTNATPPAFLAVSSEDGLCTAEENTQPYAERLQAAGVPFEHFIKSMGKHGHGTNGGWTTPCAEWLVQRGWAAKPSA